MTSQFWRGKRVFVTGHSGFKGSWLALWLRSLGARVAGYALKPPSTPSLWALLEAKADIASTIADIRDLAALSKALNAFQPDIVFHLAAQSLVHPSYDDPVGTYATNVMGTVHLLEAVRRGAGVRAVVNVTSDKCYENLETGQAYRESDPMGGRDPYSSSKGCAELVTTAYRASFLSSPGAPALASARAGNVIGGGDWSEDRLVPDIVRGISSGAPVVIRRPQSVRPWQHVLEPLRGYLVLAQRLFEDGRHYADGWNFGPRDEDAIPVSDLANRMVSLWGKGEPKIEHDPAAVYEAQYLRLNYDKARTQLGWRPLLTLDEALAWTVEWYRSYYQSPGTACSTTLAQIERYMQMAAA